MGQDNGGATDAQLWGRAADGDAEAFGELFARHASAVYSHCFRRCGDWSTADDLTSIVFLQAWRKRARVVLDAEQSALPWMLGIANKVVLTHSRGMRRQHALLARVPPPLQPYDLADMVAERLDDSARAQRALAVLRRLSRRDQEVVSTCLLAGLTYEQAAIALNVPVGTVRSRLSRARRRLAAIVDEQESVGDQVRSAMNTHHDKVGARG